MLYQVSVAVEGNSDKYIERVIEAATYGAFNDHGLIQLPAKLMFWANH